ncbi:MAG: Asp-tRNA(Asn)/Glu-tRNA(Gln) amidotransferase subunit GatA [Planctomycetota bacterium]
MTAPPPTSARALAAAIRSGTTTAVATVERALARIRTLDPDLHAFLELWPDRAVATAAAVDAARRSGDALGPLAGVPIAVKDNIVLADQHSSAGSRMLAGFRSPYSATVLTRLEAAGAVLLGRTNMDEFGMGSTTETSAHGPTRNPHRPDLIPGGSSGGSAVAVAADFCPLALGSDTGGSVRQPAAMCGVTGLKPTYGRVSRHGLIAYASSLDCIGAFARDASDLALWLDIAAGHDPADPTSLPDLPAVSPTLAARADLRGLRVGIPWELNGPGLDDAVAAATKAAATTARDLGAGLVECALPTVTDAVATYYLIATAEAASNLARYDGVRYGLRRDGLGRIETMMTRSRSAGFGDEVQLRILLGTFASAHGYAEQFHGRAEALRARLRADYAAAFAKCDVLLSPTSPVPAFPLGSQGDDPLTAYLCDALTVPASLAGLPAVSLPFGATADHRPLGVSFTAPHAREDLLLQVAHVLQQHTSWHLVRPLP